MNELMALSSICALGLQVYLAGLGLSFELRTCVSGCCSTFHRDAKQPLDLTYPQWSSCCPPRPTDPPTCSLACLHRPPGLSQHPLLRRFSTHLLSGFLSLPLPSTLTLCCLYCKTAVRNIPICVMDTRVQGSLILRRTVARGSGTTALQRPYTHLCPL